MIIGVPKEIKTLEFRVALTPAGVRELIKNGHDWADDHISVAKENMDQVFDFMMNEFNENDDQNLTEAKAKKNKPKNNKNEQKRTKTNKKRTKTNKKQTKNKQKTNIKSF